MKKAMLIAAVMLLATGCATAQPTPSKQCGSFDTERLRADLDSKYREDGVWYETLIAKLAWQLDCERMKTPNAELSGATLAERPTRTPGYASAPKTEE